MTGAFSGRFLLRSLCAKPLFLGSVSAIVGGGAIAGVTCLEINNGYPISGQINKFVEILKTRAPNASLTNQTVVSSGTDIFSLTRLMTFLNWAWGYLLVVPTYFESTFNAIVYFFQNFPTIWQNAYSAATRAKEILSNNTNISNVLRNVFNNFPQIMNFLIDSEKSKTFWEVLSDQDQLNKISKSLEALSGVNTNSPVKLSDVSIVDYIGERCIEKIETCGEDIKKIGNFFDKAMSQAKDNQLINSILGTSSSSSLSSDSSSASAFSLSKSQLDSLLEVRSSQDAQDGYEAGLILEIAAHKAGMPLWGGTSSVLAIAGTLFSKIF